MVRDTLTDRYLINASECGTGKTTMCLHAIIKSGLKAIIICPAYLTYTWKSEIEKHFEGVSYSIFPEYNKKSHITICSYDRIDKLLMKCFETTPIFLVFDEAHYLCNPYTKRTKNAIKLMAGLSADYCVLATGTPIKNRVSEYWQLFSICSSWRKDRFNNNFKNKWVFATIFSNKSEKWVSGRKVTQFYGVKNLENLKKIYHNYVKKIYLKDVICLPEMREQTLTFNDDFADSELEKTLDKAFSTGHISSVKAKWASSKTPFTAKYISEMLEEHEKIVVFSDHVEPLHLLASSLYKHSYGIITGEISADKRQEIIKEFQSGNMRIIFCTILAAGVGITLTSANILIFNDLSWVPANNTQAAARINRIGQTKTCLIKYIARKGIDEMITNTLKSKGRTIDAVQN